MPYLVTWIEGEEVVYRFVDERELAKIWETEKNFIVTKLDAAA
ncbi:hypothetical protein [Desulfofundulus thermobenzoicus]|nr:hypothetical protein [Desulfofundulus thermobenzoicus]